MPSLLNTRPLSRCCRTASGPRSLRDLWAGSACHRRNSKNRGHGWQVSSWGSHEGYRSSRVPVCGCGCRGRWCASSGYASRSRHGIHSVLDVETALAATDAVARLEDRLAAGERISGPAARRALAAVAETPRFQGRIVTKNFARQAADYLARDGLALFDNPDGCLICVFKRDTALCEPGPDATAPSQHDCRPGCGNAVRTDQHARNLHERAARTDQLAAHAPRPVARRLRAVADRDRAVADAHDATALPAEALA